MRAWFRGKQKHFIFWSILLIYALLANPLYVQLLMKTGKPSGSRVSLPAQTNNVAYELNQLQPVVINGQNLYELRGFALDRANPTQANRITVILSSAQRNVVFSTQPVQYPYMIQSYPGYTNAMNRAEFSVLISNDGLAPGVYRVGILLEGPGSPKTSFVLTNSTVTKTYNTIQSTAGKN